MRVYVKLNTIGCLFLDTGSAYTHIETLIRASCVRRGPKFPTARAAGLSGFRQLCRSAGFLVGEHQRSGRISESQAQPPASERPRRKLEVIDVAAVDNFNEDSYLIFAPRSPVTQARRKNGTVPARIYATRFVIACDICDYRGRRDYLLVC